ncbi:MAG: hypothetical protein ACRDC5_06100 [Vibrio sp.]
MGFRRNYTVITKVDGEDANGNWIEGVPTPKPVMMSVQPLGADDMKSFPEGRKTSGAVKCYTSEILPDGSDGVAAPFELEANGKLYECVASFPFQSGVISHWRYYMEYRKNL